MVNNDDDDQGSIYYASNARLSSILAGSDDLPENGILGAIVFKPNDNNGDIVAILPKTPYIPIPKDRGFTALSVKQ